MRHAIENIVLLKNNLVSPSVPHTVQYDNYTMCGEESNFLKLNLANKNLQAQVPVKADEIGPTPRVPNMANNGLYGDIPTSVRKGT